MSLVEIFPVAIEHLPDVPGEDVSGSLRKRGWDVSGSASRKPPFRPEMFVARRLGGLDKGGLLAAAASHFELGDPRGGTALVSMARLPGLNAEMAALVVQVLASCALLPALSSEVPFCVAFESAANDVASARAFAALEAKRSDGLPAWVRTRLKEHWLPAHESETAGWAATAASMRRMASILLDPSLTCARRVAVKSGSFGRRLQADLPQAFRLYSTDLEALLSDASAIPKILSPDNLRAAAANE